MNTQFCWQLIPYMRWLGLLDENMQELNYPGYTRQSVDCVSNFNKTITCFFMSSTCSSSSIIARYIAFFDDKGNTVYIKNCGVGVCMLTGVRLEVAYTAKV